MTSHRPARRRIITALMGLGAWGAILAAPVHASPQHITFNDTASIAFDQPRVPYQFQVPSEPPGNGDLVGPEVRYHGLLDSGAQGILLGKLAYLRADGSVDPDMYEQATRDDGSDVYYSEIGVAGRQSLEVYEQYDMLYAGTWGTPVEVEADVRAFGSSLLEFGSFGAVIGTPAMVGKVSAVDLTPLANQQQLDFSHTTFMDAPPPITENTYHIPVGKLPPDPSSGRKYADDPTPTLASLPRIDGMTVRHQGLTSTRNLIVDTGGQLSIISKDVATSVGIDPEADALQYLQVDGIGGTTQIPLVALDEIVVPTAEGVDLKFRDLVVGVIDVASIDGVLGMNVLTSGYFRAYGSTDPDDRGWFDDVYFDFTQNEWVVRLDLNPAFNNVVPEPGALTLLSLASLTLFQRPRRRKRRTPYHPQSRS